MARRRTRRARERSEPFAVTVELFEQDRPLESTHAAIARGSFGGEDHGLLRHLDGELLKLKESGLTLEDAKNCVRAGAEVYVNPDFVEFDVRGTELRLSVQRWLSGDETLQFMEVDYENDTSKKSSEVSLYIGPSGRILIHLAGHFRWPNGVDLPR